MADRPKELVSCNYPLYSAVDLGNGEIAVAGGGGKAKTGVPNGLVRFGQELHQLLLEGTGKCISKQNLQHDMGEELIMTLVKHPTEDVLAGNVNHSMTLYQINRPGMEGTQERDVYLTTVGSIRTDFSEKHSYLNTLQFNYDGTLIATGGTDSVVRIWKYPSLKRSFELRQHQNEVEHICRHPEANEIVSVCRGGQAVVWAISKGNPLKSFSCESSKHRIKSCRYSPRNKVGKFHLYSCCVPSKVVKNQSPKSYVQKSCRESWKILGRSSSLAGLGCAMAVSSDGVHIAVGTNEGVVYVLEDSLKILKKISRVHSVFVTGLTFVELNGTVPLSSAAAKSQKKTRVIFSVSADKTGCATMLSKSGPSRKVRLFLWLFVFLLLLVMAMVVL